MRGVDPHGLACLGAPMLGEGRVDLAVELARGVVGDVEQSGPVLCRGGMGCEERSGAGEKRAARH